APAPIHEEFTERLSDLVKVVCEELNIPYKTMRSTTFREKKGEGGAEADASFYLRNAGRMRGRRDLNLRRDPPPDWTTEAVNTHQADSAVEVWRRLRVPEVWVADAPRVQILSLRGDGSYAEAPDSAAFPYLTADELFGWMTREDEGTDLDWIK